MKKSYKEIILAIFIIVFGTITWFFLHRVLYFKEDITFLILTILGFLFFGISIGLGSLLINRKIILYLAFVLSLLSFFIFFRGGEAIPGQFRGALYYFVVLVFIFIALILYRKRVKHEADARIKLHFWHIFRKGLPLVFTLICLLIALAYYFSPFLGEASKMKIEIPRKAFDAVIQPLSGLIRTRLPLYSPDMTVNELLTMFSFVDGEGVLSGLSFEPSPELYRIIQSKGISIETLDLNQLLKDPEIAELLQQEIKNKTDSLGANQLAQQRVEFSKKLGIEIEGNETLNDFLYKLANSQIDNLGGSSKKYIPLVFAIVLFFVLRGLVIILIPFIVLFSCFLIKILISTGFAKITTKSIEIENIEV